MSLPKGRRRVDASVGSVGQQRSRFEAAADQFSIVEMRPSTAAPAAGARTGTTIRSARVAAEPTPPVPTKRARTPRRTARIDVWKGHWATLEPVVPEIREFLQRTVIEFDPGGPLGHRMRAARSTYLTPVVPHRQLEGDRVVRPDVQILPQGLVAGVREWLEELGYEVETHDHREDSGRWVRHEQWKRELAEEDQEVVEAVAEHTALRMVMRSDDRIADAVAVVARAYPMARIAVAVSTYELLDRITPRLTSRLDEPLGLFTARKKRSGRVAVGLVGQFPRGDNGDWDLLVLPYAESTVGDAALRVTTSGQYRRILAFTRTRWTSDENINQRLLVVAECVWPEERGRVPVTTLVLETHGTRPTTEKLNAFEEKKLLYWCNARRNGRIAEVARCLTRRSKKAVRTVVGNDELLVGEIVCAAKSGVAILVESPVHARELARLLPGWKIWSGNERAPETPESGCGVIATEIAALTSVIGAGVLIRATGTKWKLPAIDWPQVDGGEPGVLIDFADSYHALAARNAKLRMTEYAGCGRIITATR